MPSFILRSIDPEFWRRVQLKAKAENVQIRAVILRLLAAWLGVLVLAVPVNAQQRFPDRVVIYSMGSFKSIELPSIPDPRWHFVGVADVDGTRRIQLLWRYVSDTPWDHETMPAPGTIGRWTLETTCVWQMCIPYVSRIDLLPNPGPDWELLSVTDLDGDGKADLLWRGPGLIPRETR